MVMDMLKHAKGILHTVYRKCRHRITLSKSVNERHEQNSEFKRRQMIIDREAREILVIRLVASVRPFMCLFVCVHSPV